MTSGSANQGAMEEAPAPNETDSNSPATGQPGRFRWKPAVVILALGIVAHASLWQRFSGDRTYEVFSFLYVWPADLFLLGLWWTFASGLAWRSRMIGWGIVFAVLGTLGALFRVQDVQGDMVPKIVWRWTPSAEAEAALFWQETDPAANTPALATLEISPEDWPEFRGLGRNGVIEHVPPPSEWLAQPLKLLWKHPVGPAWSSFAIVGDRAWTQEQRHDEESVVCYDAISGQTVYVHSASARHESPLGRVGPRATPTISNGQVFTLGATGILNCLDARSGAKVWSRNILEDADAGNLPWAMAGSPLVDDRMVVVNPGGSDGRGVIAYDRDSGEILWTSGNHPAAYAGAKFANILGNRQVLIFNGFGLCAFDSEQGTPLWEFAWANSERINVAQPIALSEDRIFIAAGYGKGGTVVTVTKDGDQVTADSDWTASQSRQLKLKFNDAVYHDGCVYGLDEGILTCLDLDTRKRRWKGGRYGYGQVLLCGKELLVQTEEGEMIALEASPAGHQELSRQRVLDGKCWNQPAIAQGKLFVRNATEAACYEIIPR